MDDGKPITIVLADDHEMIRAAVRLLLDGEDGMAVVGEAADGRAAVRLARELSPDVVVMDLRMPALGGPEAVRQAAAAGPGVRVLVMSAFADGRVVREVLDAGASGYVVKDAAAEELPAAVRAVARGAVYLHPHVAAAVGRTAGGS